MLSFVEVSGVTFERHFLAVAYKVTGIIRVCVSLIIVAEEHIEAVSLGNAGSSVVATAPLAKSAGCVAGLFEHLCNGYILGPHRPDLTVPAHGAMACMLACHQ